MNHYDMIIAGGGAAGLSLAYQLINSPLRDTSILLIDKGSKAQNDRTWAFWTDEPTPFELIVYRSWDQLHLADDDSEQRIDLEGYRYQMIRGIDFYRFVHAALEACPNVTRLQANVDRIEDGPAEARVIVGGQTYSADWVFDSIFRPAEMVEDERRQYLQLHFKGWEIETAQDVFRPEAATLMDFRTPQERETRFFYVLPFSPRRALVEFTAFADDRFSHEEYAEALREYLAEVLGVTEYRVVDEEQGVIPATDHDFPRQAGRRVMTIGTKGGRVKPTTGYAFIRIQRELGGDHPLAGRERPPLRCPRGLAALPAAGRGDAGADGPLRRGAQADLRADVRAQPHPAHPALPRRGGHPAGEPTADRHAAALAVHPGGHPVAVQPQHPAAAILGPDPGAARPPAGALRRRGRLLAAQRLAHVRGSDGPHLF